MRTGVVLLVALVLAAPGAAVGGTLPYWPLGKALRMLDDTRLRVGSRLVRIDSATTLCAGYGASIRRDGVRRWRHFACTYTTFTKTGVDRDVDFRLHVLSARRFSISDAYWVGGGR
jgi:hypothetical protein